MCLAWAISTEITRTAHRPQCHPPPHCFMPFSSTCNSAVRPQNSPRHMSYKPHFSYHTMEAARVLSATLFLFLRWWNNLALRLVLITLHSLPHSTIAGTSGFCSLLRIQPHRFKSHLSSQIVHRLLGRGGGCLRQGRGEEQSEVKLAWLHEGLAWVTPALQEGPLEAGEVRAKFRSWFSYFL